MATPLFRIYVLFFALWMGAGVFEALRSHPTWYADPVAWIRADKAVGFNPWPVMTGLIALSTIAALVTNLLGPVRRRDRLIPLVLTFLILCSTAVYFVPNLIRLASPTISDAEIVSISLLWMKLNVVRIVVALGVLWAALCALEKTSAEPSATR